MEFFEMKKSLQTYFFERNLNLQSKWQKYEFENLTSHKDKEVSELLAGAKIFLKRGQNTHGKNQN